MTAQISDTFIFKSEKYSLIGMTDGDLFTPEELGMEPRMLHTACYRGYFATYELTEEGLFIKRLTIRDANGNYPSIGGVKPKFDYYNVFPESESETELELCIASGTYDGLNEAIAFNGKIRLAKEFIDDLYIHMGYQKPTSFKTVLDITLKNKWLVKIDDRSQEMELKRGEFKKRYDSGNMMEAIEDAFSLDMDLE
jgi:hypothetical protein